MPKHTLRNRRRRRSQKNNRKSRRHRINKKLIGGLNKGETNEKYKGTYICPDCGKCTFTCSGKVDNVTGTDTFYKFVCSNSECKSNNKNSLPIIKSQMYFAYNQKCA